MHADKKLAEEYMKRIDDWRDSKLEAIEEDSKAFDEEMLRKQQQQEELSKQRQTLFAELENLSIAMADSGLNSEQRKKMSEKYTTILQEISNTH